MNELVRYDGDDGFDNVLHASDRLLRGIHARWNDTNEWHDPDGMPIPSPLLVVGNKTALQMWKNRIPTVITKLPLPDVDELNAAIPRNEWEKGLDGQPRAPWTVVFALYMVHLESGQLYTALNSTTGWRMAFEKLREQVAVKRMITGDPHVLPIVAPQTRPWETNYGHRKKPHLEVVDWKSHGGQAVTAQPAPQLSGPATVKPTPDQPAAKNASQHPVTATAGLTDPPKAVSSEQFFDDEIPWQ